MTNMLDASRTTMLTSPLGCRGTTMTDTARPPPPRRRKRLRLNLGKALFVLPNLFTLSSIFCGFYAIVLCGGNAEAAQIRTAALLIAFAVFFDVADGRVARMTKTQSDFGLQLDSLADLVSFGVAPAMLAYRYGLDKLGTFGLVVAFAFTGCGALRLARFNVLAQRSEGPMTFFVGTPIPLAAGMVISVMLANNGNPVLRQGAFSLAGLMLVMSYLMVSNVRYRTFKHMKSRTHTVLLFGAVVALFAFAAQMFAPGMALAMLFSTYVTLGLVEELIFFRARRKPVVAPAHDDDGIEEEDDDEDDEEDARPV